MTDWSRRELLRGLTFAGGASVLGLPSCRKQPRQPAERIFRIYTWADYFKPELLASFGKQHGCKVVVATFASNEELFTAVDAGVGQYDLLTPSSYMVATLHRGGKLQRVDLHQVPNSRYIDSEYLRNTSDASMEYSVPFALSVSGIAFIPDQYGPPRRSWTAFDEPVVAGRFTLLDDMREVLGAALKAVGASVNSTSTAEIEAAKQVAARWIRAKRELLSENYKFGLVSGEDLLVHAYSGDIVSGARQSGTVDFFVPDEGAPMSCDDFCIPATATVPGVAHAFINFMCEPMIAAENTTWSGYRAPIPDALRSIPEQLKSNPIMFPGAATLQRCERLQDLGDATKLWQSAWSDLMLS